MKRRTRTLVLAGAIVTLMAGSLAASALWSAGVGVDIPAVALGAVRFGAESESAPNERTFSNAGAPVTVTLPGAAVVEVLDQASVDAAPVIWRFSASGAALGIAGLNYEVSVREQVMGENTHDLAGGIAAPGTVLAGSTMKVFRAGTGSDCSAIPETPALAEHEVPKNVHVFEASDVELQSPGAALEGADSIQEWCIALSWNQAADGTYVNDVHVSGLSADGSSAGSFDRWHAQVGYPPALEMLGVYRNLARVEATADDGTGAQASASWEADVYPDPSNEPDIVVALDPIVTNVNPAVDPRD